MRIVESGCALVPSPRTAATLPPVSCGWRGITCGRFLAESTGVEPTNNAAERALRHAVIWRRTSGGTDSEAGSRFVERMLSVVATCRQQGRDVLGFVTECYRAHLASQGLPTLLAGTTLSANGATDAASPGGGSLG